MKKIILCLAVVMSLFASSSDKMVVAKINDTIITQNELMQVVNSKMSKNFFHGAVPDEKLLEFKQKTLITLIDRELIYQYAKKNNLVLTDEALRKEESKIVEAFGGVDSFLIALKKNQMSYDFFRSELKKEKASANVYKSRIERSFSDNDLEEYYEKNKFKFKKPATISIQLIYIKNNPNDANGTKNSDKLAKEAYQLIKDGEDFGDVAREYSDDKSRVKNGLIKNLHQGMIDESVEDEAFKLKIGSFSKIIKRPIGSYIVKVLSKKDAYQLDYEDIEAKLKKELKEAREKEALEELLEELKKDSVIVNHLK